MNDAQPIRITVETVVNAPLETVWSSLTLPEHITQWNFASPDWHTPRASNDLRPGGAFTMHMAARDGSVSFDFTGTYAEVRPHSGYVYTIADGRKVEVTLEKISAGILVREEFEAETIHTPELQQAGWQAILDNFKRYTETLG